MHGIRSLWFLLLIVNQIVAYFSFRASNAYVYVLKGSESPAEAVPARPCKFDRALRLACNKQLVHAGGNCTRMFIGVLKSQEQSLIIDSSLYLLVRIYTHACLCFI